MEETRLEQLIKFYNEDPNDPFIIYGLALEYLKTDVKKSEDLFNKLITNFPDYLPAYYQTAKLKQELGSTEQALTIYKKGIELAAQQNDSATKRELQAAHDE
jgi:tetratricopeptide (TPR) repeat protein